MTAVVTTTQAADDDIRNAAHYISQDSPLSAARFATEILECFQRIAEFPQSGREIDALATPLRRVRVSSRFRRWLVFYRRLDAETLEVVRVLHGARDVTALLRAFR